MKFSFAIARAMPMAALSSSTAPEASTRGWDLRTRRLYIRPVVPSSPVFVTMLMDGREYGRGGTRGGGKTQGSPPPDVGGYMRRLRCQGSNGFDAVESLRCGGVGDSTARVRAGGRDCTNAMSDPNWRGCVGH